MTSWDLLYNVLRANFDGNAAEGYCDTPKALASDGTAEYLYGHTVRSVNDIGNRGVEVVFEDKDGNIGSLNAPILIGADGPSSTVRKIFQPDIERTYAGYVAWRGTVPEIDVSESTRDCFSEKFTFFHRKGLQILAYLIPGRNGTLEPGERLINYVWYCNYPYGSDQYETLMTDSTGQRHHYTLPVGKISPSVWASHQQHASSVLPPQFSELVQKTRQPFVQAITDVLSSNNVFMDGKVWLVGDAVVGLRPHTAAGTSQAAMHALLLNQLMNGEMSLEEWKKKTIRWATEMSWRGKAMGNHSQFGQHPLAGV